MDGRETSGGVFDEPARALDEIAKLFLLTNIRIGSAEALGMGFPAEPLYAIFVAYDYLAQAHGAMTGAEPDGGLPSASEGFSASHAMLCLAYMLTVSSISSYFDKAYEGAWEEFKGLDLEEYSVDTRIKDLARAVKARSEAPSHFSSAEWNDPEKSLPDWRDSIIGLGIEERLDLLERFDEQLLASRGRYQALCAAMPVLEEARTAIDRKSERINRVIDLTGKALDIGGVIALIARLLHP